MRGSGESWHRGGVIDRQVFDAIGKLRVAVIGDLCLDVYLRTRRRGSERSRETGRRAAAILDQRSYLGGAANVAANAATLGAQVCAVGMVGADMFGHELRRQLGEAGIEAGDVVTDPSWTTCAYVKHIGGDRERRRFDAGVDNRLAAEGAARLVHSLERRIPQLDVVIINQQVSRGVHTPETHRRLSGLIERTTDSPIWVSDTRDEAASYSDTVRKLGREQLPRSHDQTSLIAEMPWFITRGSAGALVLTDNELVPVPAFEIDGPLDPVGAGDAFTVGAALGLGAGLGAVDAGRLGNAVAAVTITQVGRAGTATPEAVAAVLAGRAGAC